MSLIDKSLGAGATGRATQRKTQYGENIFEEVFLFCKNFKKYSNYRDSPVSAVSISAVPGLVRFTNRTK